MTQKTNLVFQGKAKDFITFLGQQKMNGVTYLSELVGYEEEKSSYNLKIKIEVLK